MFDSREGRTEGGWKPDRGAMARKPTFATCVPAHGIAAVHRAGLHLRCRRRTRLIAALWPPQIGRSRIVILVQNSSGLCINLIGEIMTKIQVRTLHVSILHIPGCRYSTIIICHNWIDLYSSL